MLQARNIREPQIQLSRVVRFAQIRVLPADSYILLVSQP